MKPCLFGIVVLSGALAWALPAQGQPAPPAKTESQLLFDKCQTAYGELKSYRGVTKAMSLSLVNGSPNIYEGSARISFQKPGLLRIDGKLAGGGDFSILGNADGSWYRWPLNKNGDWKKVEELDLAIASMTGVAATAPTTIPSLLIQSRNAPYFGFSEEAKMDGEEKVAGQMCHKLTARSKGETTSWWIDKGSLLLRRIVSYTSEEQSAAQIAEVEKAMKKFPRPEGLDALPKSDMRFVSRIQDFEIEAINEPVDEKLFETPPMK